MIRCKKFIFDVDATLVDTEKVINNIWKVWSESVHVDYSQVQPHVHGRKIEETLRLVDASFATQDQLNRVKSIATQEMSKAKPIQGAIPFVAQLATDDWAVATSGPRNIALTSLNASGFGIPKTMICAEDVDRGKPDPMPFALAASQLNVQSNQCIAFEDSPAGVESAKAAGCFTIALLTTHSAEDLSQADLVIPSYGYLSVESSDCGDYVLTW